MKLSFSSRTLLSLLFCFVGFIPPVASQQTSPVYLNQGKQWTNLYRQQFYIQDQGSQIIPLKWMQALTFNGKPFLNGSLSRYGYLPNPNSPTASLPVGFTAAKGQIGMTCAACHTRQITVGGKSYRVDGGPAIVDFQKLLKDLDTAMGAVANDAAVFDTFAKKILPNPASNASIAILKTEVQLWYLRYHTLMSNALPKQPWGPGRLDAVSMIFNRLTGLDIGPPPTYLIPDNIKPADAPVRYPFLWNAGIQDKTQWPGFAKNGNEILGLARNVGEVFGVFATFHPEKNDGIIGLNMNYMAKNSANIEGLKSVEDLMWKIGPPKWVWNVDANLVAKGKAIFEDKSDKGCVRCHGIKKGAIRSLEYSTWKTPVLDVGTDTRECSILTRTAKTGVMKGAHIPLLTSPLKDVDSQFNILSTAVIGTILQSYGILDEAKATEQALLNRLPRVLRKRAALLRKIKEKAINRVISKKFADLKDLYDKGSNTNTLGANQGCAYEARVLQGIWAAAPYLHNGTVPTLEDLLKPARNRPKSFVVGPNYDISKVGIAKRQTKFKQETITTDCDKNDSGNSRCGHEYGTKLKPDEKSALLEYLKTL